MLSLPPVIHQYYPTLLSLGNSQCSMGVYIVAKILGGACAPLNPSLGVICVRRR